MREEKIEELLRLRALVVDENLDVRAMGVNRVNGRPRKEGAASELRYCQHHAYTRT